MSAPGTEYLGNRLTATSVLNTVIQSPMGQKNWLNALFQSHVIRLNGVPLSVQCLCMVSLERPEIIDLDIIHLMSDPEGNS